LYSCKPIDNNLLAHEIIDTSINVSGVDKIANSILTFKFRDKNYFAVRNNGMFELSRVFTKNNDTINDILSNSGFKRIKNSKPLKIQDSMAIKFSESVNSVHYFSILPYGLNDKAVQKKLLGETKIRGDNYYKIQITFSKENGGVDFDDIFIYWIRKGDFKIGYIAYLFHTNGGGMRFREVRKEHIIAGISFVDYDNYKPKNSNIKLENLDKIFEKGELEKISEINLKDIKIIFN
jgi:hypothetical protein